MKTIKSRIALFVATLMFSVGLVASPAFALPGQLPSTVTGSVGDEFSHSLAPALCEGEQGPITYSMMDPLPTGLTLNATTGLISGTYEEEGTWQLSGYVYCQYTGSNGNPAQAGYPNSTTFTVNAAPADFTPTPALSVTAIGGANCTLEVTGEFPEVQDANSVKLIFESDNGILELTLANQAADTPFTFTYPINNYSPGTDPMVLAWDGDGQIRCSTDIDVQLGYRYRTAPIEFAEVLDTYATFDLPTRPHIAPASAGDDLCGVYVTGHFPTSGDRGTKPLVTIESDTGEVAVIPAVDNQGVFYVWVPLDDLGEFDFYFGSLVLSGPTPTCGEMMFATATIWIEGEEQFASTMVYPNRICEPGAFDSGTACTPAPVGTFVAGQGMTQPTLCPKGTFQSFTGATECQDTPVGTYADRKGAIEPTICPSGKVTFEPGAAHVSECYSLKNQAFTSLKVASKLKFGASVTIPAETDNRIPVTITPIGVCSQTETTMRVKVGKVTRNVPAVRITAGSVAGTCSVNITNNGDPFYRGYTKNLVIKVSRTGK
jgi:hypothetical protein